MQRQTLTSLAGSVGGGAAAALVMVLLLSASRVPSAPPDGSAGLAERVEELERIVAQDPMQPDRTLLARMEAAERRLTAVEGGRSAGGGSAAAVAAREEAQLRASVELARQDAAALERRIRLLELSAHPEPLTGQPDSRRMAEDVSDTKRDLAQLVRSVSDLQDRIQRLENQRRP